jgi:hypothetical protein
MDRNERQIIDDLFARLREAEHRTGPRDSDAEAEIRRHLDQQPGAPYYMAQAIVVQQEALAHARHRVEELERQLAERPAGGGFLAGLFGGGDARQPAAPARDRDRPPEGATARAAAGPWGQRQGGGFLAGAGQTAMGVAGGMLIAEALGDLFGAGEAAAAEPPDEERLAPDEPMAEDELPEGDDSDAGDFDFDDF